MDVFTKRNALVGFVTLKALERRLRRRKRRRARLALALGLGVASLGTLAGVAVLLHRRQHGEPSAGGETDEAESEIVGEVVTATEPIPAT